MCDVLCVMSEAQECLLIKSDMHTVLVARKQNAPTEWMGVSHGILFNPIYDLIIKQSRGEPISPP